MLRAVLFLVASVSVVRASCIPVDGAQITASDLAKASSEFQRLDPALVFSFAPTVGSQRIIPAAEMERWAADHGLGKISASSACFERASYGLAPDDVSQALKTTLGRDADGLRIDVIEVCRCSVPAGRLEFELNGASLPPSGHPDLPVLWRGNLRSADGRAYPVWVRVRVVALVTVVRATTNLRSQQALSRENLEEAKIPGSPLRFPQAQTVAAYEGKIMNVSLARGAILQPGLVHAPSDVERGSIVKVEVSNGGAHLVLAARAVTAGNRGDVITLTNPTGAARFHAHVTGPGRAEIAFLQERPEAARTTLQPEPGNGISHGSF